MSWRVELDRVVQRKLKKLDPQVTRRLISALRAIESLDDPRDRGSP